MVWYGVGPVLNYSQALISLAAVFRASHVSSRQFGGSGVLVAFIVAQITCDKAAAKKQHTG